MLSSFSMAATAASYSLFNCSFFNGKGTFSRLAVKSVLKSPGLITTTLTPVFCNSIRKLSEYPSIANFDALYNLAGIEAENNNLARAKELLEQALKRKDDADAHQLLGNVYAQSGMLADALQEFKAVQLLRPTDIVPHRQLAQLYAQMGQLRDAITEQNAALVLDPKNADDWNNLGVLHARDGDKGLARSDFEHALTLDPQHAAARANLSHL